jgi:PleD family two-component response regulator
MGSAASPLLTPIAAGLDLSGPRPPAAVADCLRPIVAELGWSALSPGLQVSFSAGIAEPYGEEAAEALPGRADRALYAAKARGRNRVTLA